eukprot:s6258_g2.t1
MWTRIMDAIVKSLLSVEPVIGARTKATANYSHNCFELYGFDVLVDQDLKPWLLEVNLSPSMQADSPLDWQIKSSLLSDSFNLVGINKVTKQRLAEATRAKSKVVKVPGKPPGPPERRRRHRVSGRSVLRHQECEVEDEQDCEDLPSVPLGTLDVEELRSTANALLECTRNRNFIRLYPTRKAVRHYAVIVDSQEAMKPWPRGRKPAVEKLTASQVLASLLFGPPPSHGKTLTCRPRSRAILCCSRSIRRREQRYDALGEDGGEEASNIEASPALRSQSMPRARARKVSRRHVVVMKRSPAEVLMTAAVEAAEEDPSKDEADKASTGAATPAKQEKPSAESERKDVKALAEKLAEKLQENVQAGRPVSGQRSRTSSRPGSAATVRVAVSRSGSKADSERRDTKAPTETLDEKFRESGQASRPSSKSSWLCSSCQGSGDGRPCWRCDAAIKPEVFAEDTPGRQDLVQADRHWPGGISTLGCCRARLRHLRVASLSHQVEMAAARAGGNRTLRQWPCGWLPTSIHPDDVSHELELFQAFGGSAFASVVKSHARPQHGAFPLWAARSLSIEQHKTNQSKT